MSARALSLRAGLSPSYVNKVESGELEPSLRSFAQLALALRMTSPEIALLIYQVGTAAREEKQDEVSAEHVEGLDCVSVASEVQVNRPPA